MGCWEDIESVKGMLAENPDLFRLLLYGPPGTGKTRAGYGIAEYLKREAYGLTTTDETTSTDIIGMLIPGPNQTLDYHYPAPLRAYRDGGILVMDELTELGGDGEIQTLALLNDKSVSRFDLPNGERVAAHEGFVVVGTCNGKPEDLRPALRDRWDVRIEITTPAPGIIESLPPVLGTALQNAYLTDGNAEPYFTSREAIAWHRLTVARDGSLAAFDPGSDSARDTARLVWGNRSNDVVDHIVMGSRS